MTEPANNPAPSPALLAAQVRQLQADVEHLAGTIRQLESLPNLVEGLLDQPDGPGIGVGTGEDSDLDLCYETFDRFLTDFFCKRFERPALDRQNVRFLPCWDQHPSVTWLLELAWASFEEARIQDLKAGGGSHLAAWTLHTYYPMVDYIISPTGPMAMCSVDTGHRPVQPLGTDTRKPTDEPTTP